MKQSTCPQCGTSFRFRKNKQFCSPTCRKLNAQRKLRAKIPANASQSPSIRRDQAELFDLAIRMAERLYTLPSSQRLGYIRDVVNLARSGQSPEVRKVLTMPAFLSPNKERKSLFWRRSPHVYLTISQAADRYCQKFWNAGVADVVKGVVPEPPTGEVISVCRMAA